ncbi:P-loop containing nucleoside triphosphate hydrolase protein [Aspergillus unguis]
MNLPLYFLDYMISRAHNLCLSFQQFIAERHDGLARVTAVEHSTREPGGRRTATTPRLSNEQRASPVKPVEVCIMNLSVSACMPWNCKYLCQAVLGREGKRDIDRKSQATVLLRDVSTKMPQGTLTAIIGGSGSGKTTLLNALGGNTPKWTADQDGCVKFNGKTDRDGIKVACLAQDDILHPTLTVRETLQFAADLSLANECNKEQRHALVEQVIDDLGLQQCGDSRLGHACTGGQRRRTSIGVQILANASILLCDEPTTGLDTTSALHIIYALKRLARDGRTVILSIHSPRPEVWLLLDQIVLLSQGRLLYAGSALESVDYFCRLGYPLPPHVNPAEFLVDLVGLDTRTAELEARSREHVVRLAKAWRSRPVQTPTLAVPARSPLKGSRPSFIQQVRVVTTRVFKMAVRDRSGLAASLLRTVGMAVINGWIFFGLDGSLSGIRSRQGSLYVASNLNGYVALLHEVLRLSKEIPAFIQERNNSLVDVPAFLVGRLAGRLLIEDLPAPLLFSVVFYFMVGYRAEAGPFFIFCLFSVLTHYTALGFAVACVGATRRFASASLVCNLSFAVQSFTCDYFIQTGQIPVYVRWLKWCSYMFYIYTGLCTNEFAGQFYDCPVANSLSAPECRQYRGDAILDDLGFPRNWTVRPILAGVAYVLGFYLLGGLLLHYDLPRGAPSQVSKRDNTPGGEKPPERTIASITRQRVSITLRDYSLLEEKRTWLGRPSSAVQVVGPLSTEFKAGHLNVIMGPEGSGKSLLLESLVGALPRAGSVRYRRKGTMLYNDAIPSAAVIKSATSLVTHGGSSLVHSLTVRETIEFAALLRLPAWIPRAQRLYRAQQLIRRLGLKGCEDNMVQRDTARGISGGEYRRVTIAIQLLTYPRVLLLDEPTDGLDTFTARSLIELLQDLAADGQAIIITLQQARANSLEHFSHVLVLGSGGQQIYSGGGHAMKPYFSSLGYGFPEFMNVSDRILDLVSDGRHIHELDKAWKQQLPSRDHQTGSITIPAELGSFPKGTNSWRVIFPVVVRRSALALWRSPAALLARGLQVVMLGIVIMLFYAPLQHDYGAIQSRMGFVQEFAAFYFMGLLQNTVVYPRERDVFYFEASDTSQSVASFLLQYTVLEIPFQVTSALIFGLFAALVCDLDRSARMVLICAANCALILNCGESIGIMISTMFSHTHIAVNVVSLVISVSTVLGGIMSLHVNSFLSALNHLSPVKYLIANLASYSMRGQTFDCTDSQRLPGGRCPINDGTDVLDMYGLDGDAGLHLIDLGVCTIVYRTVAYALLRVRHVNPIESLQNALSLVPYNTSPSMQAPYSS